MAFVCHKAVRQCAVEIKEVHFDQFSVLKVDLFVCVFPIGITQVDCSCELVTNQGASDGT